MNKEEIKILEEKHKILELERRVHVIEVNRIEREQKEIGKSIWLLELDCKLGDLVEATHQITGDVLVGYLVHDGRFKIRLLNEHGVLTKSLRNTQEHDIKVIKINKVV